MDAYIIKDQESGYLLTKQNVFKITKSPKVFTDFKMAKLQNEILKSIGWNTIVINTHNSMDQGEWENAKEKI